jgi:glycosyltransferase involved in cell wall biosynthesis
LPPVEALYCGVPVIVAAGLPALEKVPGLGQIRLAPADVEGVAAALRTVLDDDAAEGLWGDAALLRLKTWQAFAADVAGWLTTG